MAVSPHFPSVSRVRIPQPAAAAMLNVDNMKLCPSPHTPVLTPPQVMVLGVVNVHQPTVSWVPLLGCRLYLSPAPPGICKHAARYVSTLKSYLVADCAKPTPPVVWTAMLSAADPLRVRTTVEILPSRHLDTRHCLGGASGSSCSDSEHYHNLYHCQRFLAKMIR